MYYVYFFLFRLSFRPDRVTSSPSTVKQTPSPTTNPRPSSSTVSTVRNARNSENATGNEFT